MEKQPQPFCINPTKITAFVLGCDPTAFDRNGNLLEFEHVFDLGKDQRYFSSILKNLNLIGISLKDIYVQNLIADYQKIETANNKHWEATAEQYLADRKKEFDRVDPTSKIPVFLTAERLCHFLLNDGERKWNASECYALKTGIPIPPEANKLERPLIPLYRHFKYGLSNWPDYSDLFLICTYINDKSLLSANNESFQLFNYNDSRIPKALGAYQLAKNANKFCDAPVSEVDWLRLHCQGKYMFSAPNVF